MGNLAAPPKAATVRRALEAAGIACRYLPACSPDLNPIEPCWSKLKTRLRARAARSDDAIEAELGPALAAITARDAQGWFRLCGHAAPHRTKVRSRWLIPRCGGAVDRHAARDGLWARFFRRRRHDGGGPSRATARQESVRALARRFGVGLAAVREWRKRGTGVDARMGPKEARSTVPTSEGEAIVVAFRRHAPLPLDGCLHGLRPTIPHPNRSSRHRRPERRGIGRLPAIEGDKPRKKRCAACPIGCCHLDLAEVQTGEGELRLRVAVDRTSKPAFVRLAERAGKTGAARFPRDLIAAAPRRVPKVLTDNGVQLTARERGIHDGDHVLDRVRDEHRVGHRLLGGHPWTKAGAGRPRGACARPPLPRCVLLGARDALEEGPWRTGLAHRLPCRQADGARPAAARRRAGGPDRAGGRAERRHPGRRRALEAGGGG